MQNYLNINGIKDSDIKEFINKYSDLISFENGTIKCKCCDEVVSMKNLGGFIVDKKKLLFFCNSNECLNYAVENYDTRNS